MSYLVQQKGSKCAFNTSNSWIVLSPIEMSIKKKIEAVGVPLKDWDIKIYRGVLTGCNEAFIIDTKKRNEILDKCESEQERIRTEELIRPILRGRDIKRYGYEDNGLFLINTHNGITGKLPRIDVNDYPAIKNHLDQYWDKISCRADKGDTPYNLRNCTYLEEFNKPKIVWNRIAAVKSFAKVDEYICIQDSMHFITGENLNYICSVLNSKIIQWLLSVIIGKAAGGNAGNSDNIWRLPIPPASTDNFVSDSYLYERYELNKEEIAFIESQQSQ